MNMYPQKNKEIATRLDNLYETSISSVLVPAVTKYGIVVGNYLVKPHDGFFQIMKRKEILYTTYNKTSAIIIAGMLVKNMKSKINSIIEADRVAFSTRNDLETFKYHIDLALKHDDPYKEGVMLARFEFTNDKFQAAKKILKQSYSRLF